MADGACMRVWKRLWGKGGRWGSACGTPRKRDYLANELFVKKLHTSTHKSQNS